MANTWRGIPGSFRPEYLHGKRNQPVYQIFSAFFQWAFGVGAIAGVAITTAVLAATAAASGSSAGITTTTATALAASTTAAEGSTAGSTTTAATGVRIGLVIGSSPGAATTSATAVFTSFKARSSTSMGTGLGGFYEYLPATYSAAGAKVPVIICWHGDGERGTGNAVDLAKLLNQGLVKTIQNKGYFPHECVVIAPQYSSPGPYGEFQAAINYVKANYNIDLAKIHMTSLSLGGYMVDGWGENGTITDVASMCVLCCAASYSSGYYTNQVARYKAANMPFWFLHSLDDPTVSYVNSVNWKNALNTAPSISPAARYTELNGYGHNIWGTVYDWDAYNLSGETVFEWMLAQERSSNLLGVGSSAGSASTAATLTGTAPAISTVAATSTVTGTVTGVFQGTGSATATATTSATAGGIASASGTVAGIATVTGTAITAGQVTSAGTSTATATLIGIGEASGSVSGLSTVSGTGAIVISMTGEASGIATTTADLTGDAEVSGSISGSSTAEGNGFVIGLGYVSGSIHGTSECVIISYQEFSARGSITTSLDTDSAVTTSIILKSKIA